ncbi:MAG: iron ABC transporter permease [Lachnospiraceae bacterium]|nr:iron ABC transporter permease [Lachnospiraceae bacterium]
MKRSRCISVFTIISVLLMIMVALNVMMGSVSVSFDDVINVFAGRSVDEMVRTIILNIRLPRIVAALLLGGSLALSGYLLQTFFANPIVGPFVLGISSGAKLTVAITLIILLSKGFNIGSVGMVVSAFFGAMLAMGFVLIISVKVKNMSILVVCGIMTGYICSAITDLLVTFADDSNIVNLHNWSLGSLSGMNWNDIRIITVITIICFVLTFLLSKPISAYRLGEAYARNMGVNITALRVMLILMSSLMAACVTAFAGPISFVGIAVPHLMKSMLKTSSPIVMIPASFLGGAVLTLFCDGIARTVFAPTEVSISSVTAVLLVPVVIVIMIKRREEAGSR